MGYTTDFTGHFTITPPLTPEQTEFINLFAASRHFTLDVKKLPETAWELTKKVGLPIGNYGEFLLNTAKYENFACLNINMPPKGVPGLWCQWVVSDSGDILEWDGIEKFYHYVEWLNYMVKHFFKPWGCKLNGKVRWQGEESDDSGVILIKNNVVKSAKDIRTNPLEK